MNNPNIQVNVRGPIQATSTYKTVILKGNQDFASQVTEPNCIYVIKWDFDLGDESVAIPENCVLEFDGGSLSNGTLEGYININSNGKDIFDNVLLGDMVVNDILYVHWFKIDDGVDCTDILQNLFTYAKREVRFEADKEYTISHQLEVEKSLVLNGNGATLKMLYDHSENPVDSIIKVDHVDGCTVENFTLYGNLNFIVRPTENVDLQYEYWQKRNAGEYDLYGIDVKYCIRVKIKNCTVHNTGIGILFRATHDYEVCDNYVHHTLCDAIANYQGCYNGVICRNTTDTTDDDGISVVTYSNFPDELGRTCNNFLIANNSVSDSRSRGISAISCNDIFIRNNQVKNGILGGIKVGVETGHGTSFVNASISENYVDCTACHGIFVTDVDNPVVSNNHVKVTADYYPVYFQRSRNAVLNGNNLTGGHLWLEDNDVTNVYENTFINTHIFSGHAPGSSYPNKTLYFKNNVFSNNYSANSKYIKITNLTGIEFYNNIMPDVEGVISFYQSSKIKIDKDTYSKVYYNEASELEIENNCLSFQGSQFNSLAGGTIVYNENYRFIRLYDKTANTLRYIPYIAAGANPAAALGAAFIPGASYFDTVGGRPLWWNGTKWVEADSSRALVNRYGVFADRPTGVPIGFAYLCLDRQTTEGATDGIMIYYKGQDTTDPDNPVDIWVDALGRVVS